MLTKELVERSVPANLKSSVTQSLVDRINNAVGDPIVDEQIQQNFISYTHVLKDGKFKTEDYLNAVMYVSFKMYGLSNLEAYAKTFPNRYANLVAQGVASKDIAAYVSAFHKGKLVNLVLEQTMVPAWVLNQHIYQQAINTQFELMVDPDVSAKVRTEAANSLLTHLKRPEAVKGQIDINIKDSSGMTELKNSMQALAEQQRQLIASGATARQIASQPLIEAPVVTTDAEFEVVGAEADHEA